MNARLRRLMADYEQIKTEFSGHPYITVTPVSGNPPDRYRVTYKLKGLRWDPRRRDVVVVDHHEAEVYLHDDYPRQKPQCTMLTDIFHPNFGPYICIGDHWAAGERLADVIIQIGDMIQYRNYNPRSPLNAEAAVWAIHNPHRLPVGNVDLYQPDIEVELVVPSEEDDLGIVLRPAPQDDDLDIYLGPAEEAVDA